MGEQGANRRIDRIGRPEFLEGLDSLPLDDLRTRRDDCLAEREYLSLLRRMVQGRAEISRAEVQGRAGSPQQGTLVERLGQILSAGAQGPSRGEMVKVGLPEEEMLRARRRVEHQVADPALSDPGALDDDQLAEAVDRLLAAEREVSASRAEVLRILDVVQDELKRRYREDPSLVLS
jgi:hypothetical protein